MPFIGIVELECDDIVGHGINITYTIDAYNGSCIAQITVAKSDYENTVYQFSGNCAVELPLAGLMSLKNLEETRLEVNSLENAWKEMGSTLPSPFMTMGILSLACIPNTRLTNRGLVDCNKFQFVDVFVK